MDALRALFIFINQKKYYRNRSYRAMKINIFIYLCFFFKLLRREGIKLALQCVCVWKYRCIAWI